MISRTLTALLLLSASALAQNAPTLDETAHFVAGMPVTGVLEPLTHFPEVLTANAVGRRASLENVPVRQLTSGSTFWAGELDADPVFVVVEKAAQRPARAFEPGMRVMLVGTVEPAPDPEAAARAWGVDQSTARAVKHAGVYLRATEVTPRGTK